MQEWRKAFEKAKARRRFDADTIAFRFVNDEGDGAQNLTLDGFDGVAVLSLYASFSKEQENACIQAVADVFQPRAIYLKRRPVEARESVKLPPDEISPPKPVYGDEVPQLVVRENQLQFIIRPPNGLSVGLYLDARDARRWVRAHAEGKTVLNCFSYTCGFGVAATAGGALRAVNIDASRKVLDWGEENARLNGQSVSRFDYISGDVFDWLQRFSKKGERFDVVVLDPPSFSNTRESRFSAAKDYGRLATAATQVVAKDGVLLACCNLSSLSMSRFRAQLLEAVAQTGRQGRVMEEMGASNVDFPAPAGQEGALKVLAVAVK